MRSILLRLCVAEIIGSLLLACNGSSFSGGSAKPPVNSTPAADAPGANNAPANGNTANGSGTVTPPPGVDPSQTIGGGILCQSNVAVALVMDVSGSMGKCLTPPINGYTPAPSFQDNCPSPKIAILIQAAQAFIQQFTNAGDLLGLATFSGQATVNAPMTSDRSAVLNAISQMVPQDQTNIAAGLSTGYSMFVGIPASYTKIIIIMSDGNDNRSSVDPAGVAAQIKQSGVTILSLGFAQDPQGASALQTIATNPSYYYNSSDNNAFMQNFTAIAAKLCR